MARPIGLAHLTAIELDSKALIDLAADAGYASVALRLRSAAPGTPVYPLAPGSAETAALRDHARARGVAVSEVELIPITPDLDLASLPPLLQVAEELGATGLIVTGDMDCRDPAHRPLRDDLPVRGRARVAGTSRIHALASGRHARRTSRPQCLARRAIPRPAGTRVRAPVGRFQSIASYRGIAARSSSFAGRKRMAWPPPGARRKSRRVEASTMTSVISMSSGSDRQSARGPSR